MEHLFSVHVHNALNTLYSVDEIDDRDESTEDDEEDEEEPQRYKTENKTDKGEYTKRFEVPVFRASTEVYDDKPNKDTQEYNVMFSLDVDTDILQNDEGQKEILYDKNTTLMAGMERGTDQARSQDMQGYNDERLSYSGHVLSIEYETPELINGQKTYQRIVFEADIDGESVYDLSLRKLQEAGMEFSSEYDGEFGSMLLTSINKRREGEGGNFNEFYLNGDIGDYAVDKQLLKSGDVVEWRYAEETDGSCGGVPDFNQIKSMLVYNTAFRNVGYALPGSNPFLLAA
ncbi:MAG: DUF4430 domain-containing protein [Candidatus Aenigmatarchaeota archaeon]|nr:MAG: DUF4430 domain-containing protein [Candidatus Aenigmarchaeota archaeon]